MNLRCTSSNIRITSLRGRVNYTSPYGHFVEWNAVSAPYTPQPTETPIDHQWPEWRLLFVFVAIRWLLTIVYASQPAQPPFRGSQDGVISVMSTTPEHIPRHKFTNLCACTMLLSSGTVGQHGTSMGRPLTLPVNGTAQCRAKHLLPASLSMSSQATKRTLSSSLSACSMTSQNLCETMKQTTRPSRRPNMTVTRMFCILLKIECSNLSSCGS